MSGATAGEGCLFCGIGASPDDDGNMVLCRRGSVYAVLNRYPYINGHLMVVPARHVALLSDLTAAEITDLFGVVASAEQALKHGMNCAGMNGGWNVGRCAGAGVEGHIHIHLLPRWPGDVNFMTTAAGTRVLSESLEDTFRKMKPWFEPKGNE